MKYSRRLFYSVIIACGFGIMFASCYSLKSASIPPELNTFFVDQFDLRARNALPTIPLLFTEALRNKILNESRLTLVEINPDISFSGEISSYRVTSVAPEAGQTAAFNRLEIGVRIVFENAQNPKANWQKNFSFFEDFDRNANFVSIQEELVNSINDQLVENIFNETFASW